MQTYTGYEYLLIDAANCYGKDKLLFEERIKWSEACINQGLGYMEAQVDQAEKKPTYIKAVMAIRKAQQGIPTGHLVELDACNSGIQIMSALTGCVAGATATGLVDPNVRADAYSMLNTEMNNILGGNLNVTRADSKAALMTVMYGSKAKPKEIFGEDTPELNAFYQAAQTIAPGAWELLQDLLGSWQPYALEHRWKLPDGFDARVKVMEKKEIRIEVDELNHATFTYEFYENEGSKTGLSNAANVVHSVDAYVLRCIHRRCNYNPQTIMYLAEIIRIEKGYRSYQQPWTVAPMLVGSKVEYYVQQYERSGMADIVIAPHLDEYTVSMLSDEHLNALHNIVISMLEHKPFEVVTIHDAFKCHANNMNHLRQHYINIFAEIADSNILSDILSQIHGKQGVFNKLSNNLSQLIKGSNYALS